MPKEFCLSSPPACLAQGLAPPKALSERERLEQGHGKKPRTNHLELARRISNASGGGHLAAACCRTATGAHLRRLALIRAGLDLLLKQQLVTEPGKGYRLAADPSARCSAPPCPRLRKKRWPPPVLRDRMAGRLGNDLAAAELMRRYDIGRAAAPGPGAAQRGPGAGARGRAELVVPSAAEQSGGPGRQPALPPDPRTRSPARPRFRARTWPAWPCCVARWKRCWQPPSNASTSCSSGAGHRLPRTGRPRLRQPLHRRLAAAASAPAPPAQPAADGQRAPPAGGAARLADVIGRSSGASWKLPPT